MKISNISEILQFDSKQDLIKSIMYIKLSQRKIKLSDNELSMLVMFSENNDKDGIIKEAIKNKYIRSKQSGENFISKFTTLSLLEKQGTGKRGIQTRYSTNKYEITLACYRAYFFPKIRILAKPPKKNMNHPEF